MIHVYIALALGAGFLLLFGMLALLGWLGTKFAGSAREKERW